MFIYICILYYDVESLHLKLYKKRKKERKKFKFSREKREKKLKSH